MTCHIKEYPLYLFVGACHKKKKLKKKREGEDKVENDTKQKNR